MRNYFFYCLLDMLEPILDKLNDVLDKLKHYQREKSSHREA